MTNPNTWIAVITIATMILLVCGIIVALIVFIPVLWEVALYARSGQRRGTPGTVLFSILITASLVAIMPIIGRYFMQMLYYVMEI